MNEMHRRVWKLFESIKNQLTQQSFKYIKDLLEHDEWGIALESMCVLIDEQNVSITQHDYNEIVSMGTEMNFEAMCWDGLEQNIKSIE